MSRLRFDGRLIPLALVVACGGEPATSLETFPSEIRFDGFGAVGVFDPSIARDPSSDRLWMSYSSVDASTLWGARIADAVSTRLAYSDDSGKTWTDSGSVANANLDVTTSLPSPLEAGTWTNEVSTLVYDADAAVNERWKLIWHHYLLLDTSQTATQSRRFEHGWLGYKAAATPEGLATASEIKLFAGAGYDSSNNTQNNAGSRSPLGGAPLVRLDSLHSSLATCVFSEPSLLSRTEALYLATVCVNPLNGSSTLAMFACPKPCSIGSAAAWTLATLSTVTADIPSGHVGFSAPSLFEHSGRVMVVLTPLKNEPFDSFYAGCRFYEFDDITAGALRRAAGTLVEVARYDGKADTFNGACAYHDDLTNGGILHSQYESGDERKFRLMRTGVTLD